MSKTYFLFIVNTTLTVINLKTLKALEIKVKHLIKAKKKAFFTFRIILNNMF